MSSSGSNKPARPEQVTMAALFIGFSAAISVLYISDFLMSWNSLATQETINEVAAGAEFGSMDNETVLQTLRALLFVFLAVAIAAVVFAIYVFRGHKASHVALSIISVLVGILLALGGISGLIPAFFLFGSVGLLWSAPARKWFDAINDPNWTEVKKNNPFGTNVAQSSSSVLDTDKSKAEQQSAQPEPVQLAPNDARPPMLLISFIVTLMFTTTVIFTALIWLTTWSRDPNLLINAITDHPVQVVRELPQTLGMTATELLQTMNRIISAFGVTAALGLVAAIMAVLGKRGGREFLLTMSGVAIILSIAAFPVGLLWTASGVFVGYAMLRQDVKAWFTKKRQV